MADRDIHQLHLLYLDELKEQNCCIFLITKSGMGEIVNKYGIFSRPLSLLAVMTTESRVEWQVWGEQGMGLKPIANHWAEWLEHPVC